MLTDFDMDMVGDRARRDVVQDGSISSRYKEQESLKCTDVTWFSAQDDDASGR